MSGMQHKYWDLAVQQTTHLLNRLRSDSLGERPPYEMAFQSQPDLSHVRIFGSGVQAWLPPQERAGKLPDCARTGRYVKHPDSFSMRFDLNILI